MHDTTLTDNKLMTDDPWMTLVTTPWGDVVTRHELLDTFLEMQDASLKGISKMVMIQEDCVRAVEHHAALVRKDLREAHRVNLTSHLVTWIGLGVIGLGVITLGVTTGHLTYKYARARGAVPALRGKDKSGETLATLEGLQSQIAALDTRVAAGNQLSLDAQDRILKGLQAIWGNTRQRQSAAQAPPWATDSVPIGDLF